MSAPLIWVGLPFVAAATLWYLRDRWKWVGLSATGICFMLALLALSVPVNSLVRVGPLSFEVSSSFEFLGRHLVLDGNDQAFLFLIYVLGGIWFCGSLLLGNRSNFIPGSLAILSLLVASLAVEPFLYSGLIIEIAVLISVPLLLVPSQPNRDGVVRFLVFQTLAIPFILFSGWVLAGIEANPSDSRLITQAMVFLGLGFAFWLAIFPFYTWMPLLAEQSPPYVVGYILVVLPTFVLMTMVNFLDGFSWLRETPTLFALLRVSGALMIITGGGWLFFQKNLARMLAYAVIVETGFSLIALGLGTKTGLDKFALMMIPRFLALGLIAFSLTVLIQKNRSLRFSNLAGLQQKFPLACLAIIISFFSLAGVPLLANFPARAMVLQELFARHPGMTFWVFMGNFGFLGGAVRALLAFVQPGGTQENLSELGESIMQQAFLSVGMIILVVIGIFPQVLFQVSAQLLKGFVHY